MRGKVFETAVGNFATVNLFDRWWIEENFHGGKLARSSFCLEKYLEATARPFDRGCKYLPRREFPLAWREREKERKMEHGRGLDRKRDF